MTLTTGFMEALTAFTNPRSTFNKAFDAEQTFKSVDGHKYYTWRAMRRQNIDQMTSDIIYISLYLTAALILGSDQDKLKPENVAKNQASEVKSDHGIAYEIGTYAGWVVALVASLIVGISSLLSVFQWFDDPSTAQNQVGNIIDSDFITNKSADETSTGGGISWLGTVNKYMHTTFAYVRLYSFASHLYTTLLRVDSRPVSTSDAENLPIDHRKTLEIRLYIVTGMLVSLGLGAAAMYRWFEQGLAHVTMQEYAIVIVPLQLMIGVLVASIFQAWYEKDGQSPEECDVSEKVQTVK